jgi:phosphatidylserine/phosphatidylglycerophosphate/cardiolipin synthase-like enzyme
MTSPLPVYFSPCGGCTAAIVNALTLAVSSVLVQAYDFTSATIAAAILAAKARGLSVQIILDPADLAERGCQWQAFQAAGIPVLIDRQHAIAHNKIIILDSHVVITGSFNFTFAAEYHNAENIVIVDDAPTAALFVTNWQLHAAHSFPPQPPVVQPVSAPSAIF